MDGRDPKTVVREGYDSVSYRYRSDDAGTGQYEPWLNALRDRLRAGSTVLDLGCGCGVPVARDLATTGYHVTGVDISAVQIERAHRLVPLGTFIRADFAGLAFDDQSFDAITCFFALIHLPVREQAPLLHRIARWLRPGGILLATVGHLAWTGTEDAWLGGEAPMWWSHPDANTYRQWLADAGLAVTDEQFVPEGTSGHLYVAAERR